MYFCLQQMEQEPFPNDQGKSTPRAAYSRIAYHNASERIEDQRNLEKEQHPLRRTAKHRFIIPEFFPEKTRNQLPEIIRLNLSIKLKEVSITILEVLRNCYPEASITSFLYKDEDRRGISLDCEINLSDEERKQFKKYISRQSKQYLKVYLDHLARLFFDRCGLGELADFPSSPIDACLPLRELRNVPEELSVFESVNRQGTERLEILLFNTFENKEEKELFGTALKAISNPRTLGIPLNGFSAITGSYNDHCGYCRLKKEDWGKFHLIWKILKHKQKRAKTDTEKITRSRKKALRSDSGSHAMAMAP